MEFPSTLAGQLAALTLALDEPGTDLQAIVDVLIEDLTSTIPSFLGLTVVMNADGLPIALSSLDDDLMTAAGSSMSVPVDPIDGWPGATLVFYAYNPGAFVDLATDARRALGLDGEVVLDEHLVGSGAVADPRLALGGVEDATMVNRAIGVLIARGHPPERARAVLDALAAAHNLAPVAAALRVLESTQRRGV
jgi:hypothetical protein